MALPHPRLPLLLRGLVAVALAVAAWTAVTLPLAAALLIARLLG